MNNDTVSIVVLNYNDYRETVAYVNAIQDYTVFDEIIIVDNCSTDDSYDHLLSLEGGKVHVYKTEKNGGYGYGNNFGISISRERFGCKYTFVSNPDVAYSEETATNMVNYLQNHDNCALVSCLQYNGYTKSLINDYAWRLPSYRTYVFGALALMKCIVKKGRYDINQSEVIVDCVPGAFLAVDTEKFSSIGGYDQRVFLFCEESMLAHRIIANQYYSCLLTNDTYYHNESTSISKSIPGIANKYRLIFSSREFYLKNYLNCGNFRMVVARACYRIAILEVRIKSWIKKKTQKRRE